MRYLQEIRISEEDAQKHKVGEQYSVSVFSKGEKVNVSGTSKGKGFQGVIKRHGFSRGPESHGSDHHREPGSIGGGYPQRVLRGQKLPGRMGHSKVTVKNLVVEKIDPEEDVIYLRGAVPGPNKSTVLIVAEGGFEAKVVEASQKESKKSVQEPKNTKKEVKKPEKNKEEAPKTDKKQGQKEEKKDKK